MITVTLAVGIALADDAHATKTELHWVRTEDGADLALERYANPGGTPVVLCHGISSNHWFWDLEPGRSLALYLHDRGYDVWNMDLRGHGHAVHDRDGKRQKAGWTVDDYGEQDLPAAFAYVQAQNAGELHYVGHSMGGMVLAVYLAAHAETPLVSATVVASPLDFRDPDVMTALLLRGAPFATPAAFLPSPAGARLIVALDTGMPLHIDQLLYNPDNINREARRLMTARIVSPLSRGEIKQFAQAATDGEFRSADGERIYRERLGEVEVPMLFFAGRADRVANPDRVYGYYEAVGSPDKQWVMASIANGFHGDYGHLDLGVGDHVEVDVFPRIEAWIASHDAR